MPRFIKLKYRHKIAVIIFLFTLVPLVILGLFFIEKVWSSKAEEIISKNEAQLANSVNDIDGLLSSNTYKMLYINNNYYINTFLENNTDQDLVGIMSFNDYLQSVVEAIIADNSKTEVNIYALDNTTYSSYYLRSVQNLDDTTETGSKSVKDQILQYGDSTILWKLRTLTGGYNAGNTIDYICGYKKMMTVKRPLAIIEIRIPFSQITGFFQYDIPKDSFIVFEMKDGSKSSIIKTGIKDVQPEAKGAELYSSTLKLSGYYTIDMALKSGAGKISMFIPKNLVLSELKLYLFTVVGIFFIIIIILFFTIEVVSFFLTKKLQGLVLKMNTNVENLITNENMEKYSTEDEFGTIENMIHKLIIKTKEYYKKINEYEMERKSFEAKLLQERINPHFLYNTLSTLKWVSEDKKVQNVIDSMVKYYRIALSKGTSIITICQEVEMTGEYLKLQKFAYGNDFEFQISIEEGVGDCLILKNLLQPIVENAVMHGLNGRETGGQITISAKRQAGDIIFEIADNGAGMERDKVEKLLQESNEKNYKGYGMKNIQKRIEVFYGKGYGIDIRSTVNQGTTVIIKIPCFLNSDIYQK